MNPKIPITQLQQLATFCFSSSTPLIFFLNHFKANPRLFCTFFFFAWGNYSTIRLEDDKATGQYLYNVANICPQ